MPLTQAGPAEILRASQKDELYLGHFQTLVSDAVLHLYGARFSAKYRHLIEGFGAFFYYGVTTLSGFQTLGEEYTGIIQTDPSYSKLPNFMTRFLMVCLECFGSLWLDSSLARLERLVSSNNEILPSAKQGTRRTVGLVRWALPLVDRAHRTYFYWAGGPHSLYKRLTAIHYVLSRGWLKQRESAGLRWLSYVSAAQIIASLLKPPTLEEEESSAVEEGRETEGGVCGVCLLAITHPCLTPCGHLHCYPCLLEWLHTSPVCPTCRSPTRPSRLVPILN